MILILSEEFDNSTNKVIDWIDYTKNKFVRINPNTIVDLTKFSLNEFDISFNIVINDIEISSKDINSYWYRRGFLNNQIKLVENFDIPNYKKTVNNYLIKENEYLKEIFYTLLETKTHIGKISDNKINKLKVLLYAKEIGLSVPDTIITNTKTDLINFFNKHNEIITKSIKDNIHLELSDCYFVQYTDLINKKDLEKIPEVFFSSIFQQLIKKKFELRIFYLNNKFYSTAIFSQTNDKTKIDFRHYDDSNPNRVVPFILPTEYEIKLQKLMNKLNLISGSIDVLVAENGEFYFLEVNPVGQFGQVSSPCNYYIEREIANYLCL
jgi:ATP-GRASP peptide maturase of grasp-with-spasm system